MKRKYSVTVEYELEAETVEAAKAQICSTFALWGFNKVNVSPRQDERTERQNRALHLYFQQVADALNDAGYDMRLVVRPELPIPCTGYLIKERLWKPTQEMYLNKKSTTKLNKSQDINKIYDIVNRVLGERFGVHVPFPDIHVLLDKNS